MFHPSFLSPLAPNQGYCYAAGMAQLEDGAFYAAAPQEAEACWRKRGGSRMEICKPMSSG